MQSLTVSTENPGLVAPPRGDSYLDEVVVGAVKILIQFDDKTLEEG